MKTIKQLEQDIEDVKVKVTITLDSHLVDNLKNFRKAVGMKSLSGRINDLLWKWLEEQKGVRKK